jgi:hypothetical protein
MHPLRRAVMTARQGGTGTALTGREKRDSGAAKLRLARVP